MHQQSLPSYQHKQSLMHALCFLVASQDVANVANSPAFLQIPDLFPPKVPRCMHYACS
jgi:hypothetical protein